MRSMPALIRRLPRRSGGRAVGWSGRRGVLAGILLAASTAGAQDAVVAGQVFLKDAGTPLGYTTVSVLSRGTQILTGESGKFMLLALSPGQVRVRFKRIGFAHRDTTLTLAANDTLQLRIELSRLVLQLPAMVVSGKCTNQAPLEPQPAILAELFDQVSQNAEHVKLLAVQKPFELQSIRLNAIKAKDGRLGVIRMDTILRTALPPDTYTPKMVVRRGGGADIGRWVLALPELPDFADTAFTNHHCFRYAGRTHFEVDSVIKVDFEPVPWLDKEVDIEGSLYLRLDNYQLVGLTAKLNRIPSEFARSGLLELNVRARFSELVPGFPVLTEWELTNRFRSPTLPRVEQGQVIAVKWRDSTAAKVDTVRR
jgi:hypothetical protein